MNHATEEQLVLHYYGEAEDGGSVQEHLEACAACRELYGSLQRTLNLVDSVPVPERGDDYGRHVWRRLEPRLGAGARAFHFGAWRWAVAATAVAALLVAAFLAGRFYPAQRQPVGVAAADPQVRERILLVAVGDYLERSEMVLIEIANAADDAPRDISSERAMAAALVSETRLYRQTAAHTGNAGVESVLDDLERSLLAIAHAPSEASPRALNELRNRLQAEGILFKVRVLGSNLRRSESGDEEPAAGRQRL